MRIRWKEQFKEDFQKVEEHVKDPSTFREALYEAISILKAKKIIESLSGQQHPQPRSGLV